MRISLVLVRSLALLLAAAWAAPTLADPPAHAPAHGWRAKQAGHYNGRTVVVWNDDFEISAGRCNRDTIAAVVGGVVGGAIANKVADEHREVATIIGIAAGALIGHRIGRELDERDRACLGHALELGASGRPVVWTNESTGVRYELTPGRDRLQNGAACREFALVTAAGDQRSSKNGLACPSQPGVWQIAQ